MRNLSVRCGYFRRSAGIAANGLAVGAVRIFNDKIKYNDNTRIYSEV